MHGSMQLAYRCGGLITGTIPHQPEKQAVPVDQHPHIGQQHHTLAHEIGRVCEFTPDKHRGH
jgi:hypothetical protein